MKIAISSQNFSTITGHAGRTKRFFVYQAENGQEPQLLEKVTLPKEMTFHEYRAQGLDTSHPLDGVELLITASAGVNFQQQMTARNIRLVITEEPDPVVAIRNFFAGTLVELSAHDNCGDDHHHHHDHNHHHKH